MKKLIVCATIVGMLLCGCSGSNSDMDGRFVTVETDGYGYYSIIVDTETNVMYLKFDTGGYRYGITVLMNADGTPMLWGEGTLEKTIEQYSY